MPLRLISMTDLGVISISMIIIRFNKLVKLVGGCGLLIDLFSFLLTYN